MRFSIDPLHAHLRQASAADALRVLRGNKRQRRGMLLTEAFSSGDVRETGRLPKLSKK